MKDQAGDSAVDAVPMPSQRPVRSSLLMSRKASRLQRLASLLGEGLLFLITSSSLSYSAEVTLVWDANTESDLTGYKLYYKTGSSGEPYDGTGIDQGDSGINISLDNLATPDNPSFSLTGLQDNEFYYFVVTAVNSAELESRYSNVVTVVTYVSSSTARLIAIPCTK